MTEESSNVDTLEGDRSRDAEGSKENPSDSAHAPVLGWGSKPTFANVRAVFLFLISTYYQAQSPWRCVIAPFNDDFVCVVAVDDSRYRNCSSLHCRTILLQLIHMRLHTHTPHTNTLPTQTHHMQHLLKTVHVLKYVDKIWHYQ